MPFMNERHHSGIMALMTTGALLATGLCAQSAIIGTYADATWASTGGGNTTGNIVASTDLNGYWNNRTQADTGWENSTIFQCDDNTTNPGTITTSITGLAAGTYNVYMVYWTNTDAGWFASAALNGGSFNTYGNDSGFATGTYQPGNEGKVIEREVLLGQIAVAGNGSFSVSLAGHTTGENSNRSWYDGVAYELVPEPASLSLLALGALPLLRRRRS